MYAALIQLVLSVKPKLIHENYSKKYAYMNIVLKKMCRYTSRTSS